MSIQDKAQVTNLAALIDQPMLYELGIADHSGFEAQALHFVFQRVAADMPKAKSQLVQQQIAARNTVEEVGMQYAPYKEYYEVFFKGPHKVKPFLLALFCGPRVCDINAPDTDETGEMIFTEKHFDEKDAIDATYIFDQAHELDNHGYLPEVEEPIEESIFLSHIHALVHLSEIGESLESAPFEDYTPDELSDIQKEFKDIRSYLRLNTEIGAFIQQMMDGLVAELESSWPGLSVCTQRSIPYPANDIW